MLWHRVQRSLLGLGEAHAVLEVGLQGNTSPVSAAALLQMASRLAGELALVPRQLGAVPIVALYLSNSVAYIAAVLGALQAGCAFLPLDPRWPQRRVQQVVSLAQAHAVVYAPETVVGGHGAPALAGPRLVLAPQPEAPAQASAPETAAYELEGQLLPYCYVLFTSGSTGAPLGVLGTEQGILNRCRWMEGEFPLRPPHRVPFKTSPCFVDGIWEVFGPLLAGVPIVTVPLSTSTNPADLCAVLTKEHVTHLAAVPTLWRALVHFLEGSSSGGSESGLDSLRVAVSSGEPLPPALLRRMQAALPASCTLLNLYGSTEVAADATWLDCTAWRADGAVGVGGPPGQPGEAQGGPGVGRPLSETLVAVVDPEAAAQGRWVTREEGQEGEVLVAGSGLAAGYLGAPGETRRRFVSVPASCLAPGPGVAGNLPAGAAAEEGSSFRCFRTGDLGLLSGGCLHLRGRADLQIKVAGVRVDLLEVEAALTQHASVGAAAARVWPLPAGDSLVAYVEASPGAGGREGLEGRLLELCRLRLPPAAVPARVLLLEALPRSAAGKLQRSALPRPDLGTGRRKRSFDAVSSGGAALSEPPSEVRISRAFAAALAGTAFEPTTSLFSVGGTSLTAAQIANDLGVEAAAVVQNPTVRSLAAHLRGSSAAAGAPAPEGLATDAAPLELDGSGSGPRLAWRAGMLACVDAAPVTGLVAGRPCVFASSHGGDVCCFEAGTGRRLWEAAVGDRADAGLVLCSGSTSTSSEQRQQYLAVATNGGGLVFLETESGAEVGRAAAGGALRAAPAVDPWTSGRLVWVVTHASELLLVSAPGTVVARVCISSAASAPVAFDKGSRLAYVACLDGTLMTFSTSQDGSGSAPSVTLAWQHKCGAAVLAPPLALGAGRGVVVAAADGSLTALCPDGALAWQSGALGAAAVFSHMLSVGESQFLVGTEEGALWAVEGETGAAVALCSLGSRAVGMALEAPGTAVVCTASGAVLWLDAALLLRQADPAAAEAAVLGSAQLPGEVFGAPALGEGCVFVGCRDDHLYALYAPSRAQSCYM